MAEQIVDVLEAVEVDRERGELVGLLMGFGGVERQPFVEGDAVRQAGHGVVERELMDAVGRFRAQLQVDDIGRETRAHHQQHRADHGQAEDMRRDEIGRAARPTDRQSPRSRPSARSASTQIMKASTIAAPWRHQRVTGRLARLTASAERLRPSRKVTTRPKHVPFEVAGDVPALEGDEMHGENAGAHHEAAGFRRQREVAAADLEADQAGDDGDDAARRRSRPARSLNCSVGSSARIEMKVEAHSAAPVPTEAMNSQPMPGRARGGAGAGEMAHADPGSEQAHGAGDRHQQLVVREAHRWWFRGMARFPVWTNLRVRPLIGCVGPAAATRPCCEIALRNRKRAVTCHGPAGRA